MNGIRKLGRVTKPTPYWRVFGAIVLATTLAGYLGSGVASADTATSSAFYLAIGASESVGIQPTADDSRGDRTADGYTDDVVANEASLGIALDLHEIGCPGETTATMLYGGDTCYPAPDSQLIEALAFLQSHHNDHGLVTIDLGFNDYRTCLGNLSTFSFCLAQKTTTVQSQLTSIVTLLKAAAGPNVVFVALNHDDPFLADARNGRGGLRIAHDSLEMVDQLNRTLQTVYSSFDILVADVAAAFSLDDSGSAKIVKPGTINRGSLVACELTWMCAPAPYGPNVHPNDAGYLAIADAIEDVLPPSI